MNTPESNVLITADFCRIELTMPVGLDATIQGALAAALLQAEGSQDSSVRPDAVVSKRSPTEGGGDPDLDPDPA